MGVGGGCIYRNVLKGDGPWSGKGSFTGHGERKGFGKSSHSSGHPFVKAFHCIYVLSPLLLECSTVCC